MRTPSSPADARNRTGHHEPAIRELRFRPKGIDTGELLTQFHGVLGGEPVFAGALATGNQQ